MISQKQNKEQIISKLNLLLDIKINSIKEAITSAKESRDNETKSSVGDKYETGRAMMQMEIEKNQVQLIQIENQKNDLLKINIEKEYKNIEFGSLVFTNLGNYLISIPFGKIEIETLTVFCLSLASPIGKILAGKTIGEKVHFQGKEIEIQHIE